MRRFLRRPGFGGLPFFLGAVLLALFYPYTEIAQGMEHTGRLMLQSVGGASGSPASFTVEVSAKGFNGSQEPLTLEVQQGQEVEITFVYADTDLPQPNFHRIRSPELGVETGILSRDNPRVTLRFRAEKPGTYSFMCVLFCVGHQNLQRGQVVVEAAAKAGATSPVSLNLMVSEEPPLKLVASLSDSSGHPIPQATITFWASSDFLAASRPADTAMELGEAQTDAQGVASLEYDDRDSGQEEVLAKYEGSSSYDSAEARATVKVTAGRETSYVPRAGIDPLVPLAAPGSPVALRTAPPGVVAVPLSAPWALTLVLGGIWVTYFIVVYQVFQIGSLSAVGGLFNRRLVPTFGLLAVASLAGTLLWIVQTSPYTHHHLGSPSVPWLDMSDPHPDELDFQAAVSLSSPPSAAAPDRGRAVFQSACAACHGPNAEGGFGPSLKEHKPPVAEVRERVREGFPGKMQAFASAQLSDSDLENLVDYLLSIGAAKEEGTMEGHSQ